MYDMKVHIPQLMEKLFECKSNADIAGFDYILEDIKKLMKDETAFIKGLEEDQKNREEEITALFNEAKKTILNGFKDKNNVEGVNHAHAVVSQLSEAYNAIEIKYMDDAVTTCTSYRDQDTDDRE